MQTCIRSTHRRLARHALSAVIAAITVVLPLIQAQGQLAITEVLSSPSTNPVTRGEDYWELTNFGTEDVDLSSFWFRDEGGFSYAIPNLADLW
jgi:hypothetical protein